MAKGSTHLVMSFKSRFCKTNFSGRRTASLLNKALQFQGKEVNISIRCLTASLTKDIQHTMVARLTVIISHYHVRTFTMSCHTTSCHVSHLNQPFLMPCQSAVVHSCGVRHALSKITVPGNAHSCQRSTFTNSMRQQRQCET